MARMHRRPSIAGALILITIGAVFLYANMRPDFDPWNVLSRYWPLILIFWGLGRIFDYFLLERSADPNASVRGPYFGEILALAGLVALFFYGVAHWHGRGNLTHEMKSIEAQGAQSLNISVDIPAGDLKISGGASVANALEADFGYRSAEGKPQLNYDVNGGRASLAISQDESGAHTPFRTANNRWDLKLNSHIPCDLKVKMGAGRSNLRLKGVDLGHLDVEIGAGELEADLTGDWKRNLEVNIEGGVGGATIRLPENVGVEVHAHGGIGSVSAGGLKERGDDYVNDALGKSPVTMRVEIQGGVGRIRLLSEP